ncbi:DNA-directed RNA polymerase subunit delta [Mangrovibacillus cuniculi]|uniref:Probable DNA-directed RNA polymerase subunit delta n=1 Tax=Mangrovibacillus cuniculi TaxID=2593652 RepID=A0A7S8CDF4_9BACI|nr:DNA-directed RNA polymerase subunit delta [Mangrovibacillus cuniculi]QPC47743.1 DNA-directed RNA polymerase subunit delta [Mangrovibacillus cuniculi]
MSVRELPQDQLQEMSFIEVATALLTESKQPMTFQEMVDEISSILSLSEEETKRRMIPFYTDLNVDGRFLAVAEGRWGLRAWYPLDQVEEEQAPTIKVRKKKAKAEDEEDGFDDIEEDLDLEELDDFEDEDLTDEEDFDDIDEDDDEEDDDDLEVIDEDLDILSDDEEEDEEDLEDDLDEDEEL